MSICTLLSMTASVLPDRLASTQVTLGKLERDALQGAAWFRANGVGTVAFLGQNSPLLATLLFSAAGAGVPFAPLSYRLPSPALQGLLDRLDSPLLVADAEQMDAAKATGHRVLSADDWIADIQGTDPIIAPDADADAPAVLLFTSGTTAEPKCVVLRHAHLLVLRAGHRGFRLGRGDRVRADLRPALSHRRDRLGPD